jgi:hypothetical protein
MLKRAFSQTEGRYFLDVLSSSLLLLFLSDRNAWKGTLFFLEVAVFCSARVFTYPFLYNSVESGFRKSSYVRDMSSVFKPSFRIAEPDREATAGAEEGHGGGNHGQARAGPQGRQQKSLSTK